MSTGEAETKERGMPSLLRALSSLRLIVSASFRAAPTKTVLALILYPASFVEVPIVSLGLRYLANGAVGRDGTLLLTGAIIVVAAVCLFNIFDLTAWQLCLELEDRVGLELDRRVCSLVSTVPGIEHFERPEYLNRLEVLRERGWMLARAMYALPMNFADVVRAVVTFALLASVNPLLLLLALFSIPSILIDSRAEKRVRDAEERSMEGIRRARHFYELGTHAVAGSELRAFGLRGEIFRRHRVELQRVNDRLSHVRRRTTARSVGGWIFFSIGYAAAVAFAAYLVVHGRATVGDLILTITLASQINRETRVSIEILSWSQWVARIGEHLLWLEGFAKRHRGRNGAEVAPVTIGDGIGVEGVSFEYPGTDRYAISDLSLFLPAGSVVALVGENGAGKTTLAKLLCRFYEPTAGRILADRRDISQMDLTSWRERVTASFQDFHRFQFTAKESVGIGDLPRHDDEHAVRAAVERADANDVIARLPAGLQSRLGSLWPDGQELSGGQWQKLALARSMMRTSPLLFILDEPTASLDPQTEHALFRRQIDLASRDTNGTITLLVSHRFSNVAEADLIVVLDHGRIVERGTFRELMEEDGLFAELYRIQARAYIADAECGDPDSSG